MNKAENALAALKRHYGADAFKVEKEAPFRALIGCILSQRTRDENASKAAGALFAIASTPQQILALDPETLKQLIRPSGYYNQKAKHIIGASRAILDEFGGETPKTREELLTLPGVGPKTADIVLSYGYGEPAIAIDTHIHRTSKRLGLAPEKAKPTEVKRALESALPRCDWTYADGSLLQLGKDYCRPKKPLCGDCPLKKQCENSEP
jgi:endonuclease III